MAKQTQKELIPTTEQTTNNQLLQIEPLIRTIRGQQVLLDSDLAILYGVETKRLNQQVKRNIERFPKDFMFQLTQEEVICSRSQYCDLKQGYKLEVTNCNLKSRSKFEITNCDIKSWRRALSTLWLTQEQIAELFQKDQSVIARHIANIFKEGELDKESNMQILHNTLSKYKPTAIYNLDVIISVGYRVKSQRGV